MPEINVPLLRTQLEWATEQHELAKLGQPSEWNQEVYWCGTAGCIAGHTAIGEGWRPLPPRLCHCGCGRQVSADGDMVRDGTESTAEAIAVEALGLTDDQSDDLFDGYNTIRELWGIARRITDGAIEIPAGLA